MNKKAVDLSFDFIEWLKQFSIRETSIYLGKEKLRVIIAGSRDFNNYELLYNKCENILYNIKSVEIVSGGAKGADSLGEKYAKEKGYKIKQFTADWNSLGKSAGYIRNKEMAEYADALIAFWDGESKGTKHMINLANKNKLKVRVIYV